MTSTLYFDPEEEWNAFVAGHRQQLEDALLPTLGQAQEAGIIPPPEDPNTKLRREAALRGIHVQYPDGEPPAGTPMKLVTFQSPVDGQPVQVPMPADPPANGIRVLINGIEGVMYADPTEAGPYDQDADEVEAAIAEALDVQVRLIGATPEGESVYGFSVSPALREELIEAWNHYQDHSCQAGAMMLDRITEQFIEAFLESRG